MIYLASPYGHDDPRIREERFHAACRATANLLEAGEIVFSPIVYCHELLNWMGNIPETAWLRIDRAFFNACNEVVVLALDGWKESLGVRDEIQWSLETGKPVRLLDPSRLPMAAACIPEGVP